MVVSVSSRVSCFLFLLWRFRRVWPCWFLRRVIEGSPSLLVVLINTTSKLGLPSITLLRNQHGQTRRKRHNKKRKQDTRDETDTTTIQSRMLPIQATVAYLRARSVRTLRDPANLRARSVRTWERCTWSSSTITKASNSRDEFS